MYIIVTKSTPQAQEATVLHILHLIIASEFRFYGFVLPVVFPGFMFVTPYALRRWGNRGVTRATYAFCVAFVLGYVFTLPVHELSIPGQEYFKFLGLVGIIGETILGLLCYPLIAGSRPAHR